MNEEKLLDEFESKCEWKVSLQSSIQNNTAKENDDKNKNQILDEIETTLNDIFYP